MDKPIQTTRRTFVKTASHVAVTSPAVSILLAGYTKPAVAKIPPYIACQCRIGLDDFTFGNNEEDIDALEQGSNFNPFNGTNNQDDVFIPPPS